MGTRRVSGVWATWLSSGIFLHCGGNAAHGVDDAKGAGGVDAASSASGSATRGVSGGGGVSGDCVAPDSGARFGYHSPDPGDTWLPDCNNPLNREYWRVFQKADGDAYTMPRADAWEGWTEACARDQHALYEIGHRYGLCDGPLDAAGVRRLNAVAPLDALTMTHEFHTELVFVSHEDDVQPFAIPSDVLDACLEYPALQTGPLAERCEFEIDAKKNGSPSEEGRALSEEQALVLARALNDLYGIENDELCLRLERLAGSTLRQAFLEDASCAVDEDCTWTSNATACSSGCGAIAALADLVAIDAARERIRESVCEAREAAECDPVRQLPCIQGGDVPACVEGKCDARAVDEVDASTCNLLGEASCLEAPDACFALYAWQFDEATGQCPGRGFVQCVAAGNSCDGASGFWRGGDGQCWWSENSHCEGLTAAESDPSCGEGDPSMSGCKIR